MGSVKNYFAELGSGLSSLIKGMQVTGKEFLTPKVTERYPGKPRHGESAATLPRHSHT